MCTRTELFEIDRYATCTGAHVRHTAICGSTAGPRQRSAGVSAAAGAVAAALSACASAGAGLGATTSHVIHDSAATGARLWWCFEAPNPDSFTVLVHHQQ